MMPHDPSHEPLPRAAAGADEEAPPGRGARGPVGGRVTAIGVEVVALAAVLLLAAWLRVAYADEFGSYDELWNLALTTGHGTPFGQYGTDVIEFHPRRQ